MYAAMTNCLLNVAAIPFGAGAVSSALGGWVVVAAFLASAIVLCMCVDRPSRLRWPDRKLRWVATSRIEQGFWRFRVRCADTSSVLLRTNTTTYCSRLLDRSPAPSPRIICGERVG
jgi:hypothetical protein